MLFPSLFPGTLGCFSGCDTASPFVAFGVVPSSPCPCFYRCRTGSIIQSIGCWQWCDCYSWGCHVCINFYKHPITMCPPTKVTDLSCFQIEAIERGVLQRIGFKYGPRSEPGLGEEREQVLPTMVLRPPFGLLFKELFFVKFTNDRIWYPAHTIDILKPKGF